MNQDQEGAFFTCCKS